VVVVVVVVVVTTVATAVPKSTALTGTCSRTP